MGEGKDLELLIVRKSGGEKYTKGEMFANGVHLGYTCEDEDRFLESGGVKVKGETAIPRGRYRVIISYSNRFARYMPEVLEVPQFTGVRIHGGNTVKDTEGCPLLGAQLTPDGVRDRAAVNTHLMHMIGDALQGGGKCWLEIR